MHASTVAIDLAKEVFELAFADAQGRIIERKRLSRRAFIRSLETRPPLRVLMEACGGAHCWARRFQRQGHAVRLLPARDVRPYVRGNKTDRNDVAGILEADRCAGIAPVPVKTPEQQGIQALHRLREHLKAERTATLNLLRGVLREFGVAVPLGPPALRRRAPRPALSRTRCRARARRSAPPASFFAASAATGRRRSSSRCSIDLSFPWAVFREGRVAKERG